MRSTLLLGVGLAAVVGWSAYEGNAFLSAEKRGDAFRCTVAGVTDGDTLRCVEVGTDGRAIRVRLSGISARERDGSCSSGHPCPAASAEAATAELERFALGQVLQCSGGVDRYGRRAAFCQAAAGDLSCLMVAAGVVAVWPRYWGDHRC